MGELIKKHSKILFLILFYWFICLVMLFHNFNFLYYMLAWNTFLALLPLLFIEKAGDALKQRKTGRSVLWMILWLLFFPNSVYMITDFIHISNDKFLWVIEAEKYLPGRGVVYSTDIKVWIKLLVIGMGFLLSVLVGLESLYLFEHCIKSKVSKMFRCLGILMVALLSGVGVYIGRFLRFNSWDVLFNPVRLLKQFAAGMNGFAIQFIVAFTVFIIGCYLLYKSFRTKPTPGSM